MRPATIANITTETSRERFRPFRSAHNLPAAQDQAERAKAVAMSIAQELKTRFAVTKVLLFGSLARGDFHKWSDIDLAIWGGKPTDYYRAVAFASGYSEVFKVDLVDGEDCSESLRQHILKEGVEL